MANKKIKKKNRGLKAKTVPAAKEPTKALSIEPGQVTDILRNQPAVEGQPVEQQPITPPVAEETRETPGYPELSTGRKVLGALTSPIPFLNLLTVPPMVRQREKKKEMKKQDASNLNFFFEVAQKDPKAAEGLAKSDWIKDSLIRSGIPREDIKELVETFQQNDLTAEQATKLLLGGFRQAEEEGEGIPSPFGGLVPPEEKPISLGVGQRLVTPGGKILTKSEARVNWLEFKKDYKNDPRNVKLNRTDLDAHFEFASKNKGRFETKVVGDSLVRTDIYTDDQTIITPAKLKKSNIQSKLIRDFNGNSIGIMFYDNDEIDEEGNPKVYAPTMFADLIAENRGIKSAGAGPGGEAGEANLMPVFWDNLTQGVKDFVSGIIGSDEPEAVKRKPVKKTKKSKAVNSWLEGS